MRRILTHWAPLVFVVFLVLFLSTRSNPLPAVIDPGINLNFLHPVEFFVVAFLVLRLLDAYEIQGRFYMTIVLVTMLGIFDELIQGQVLGRHSTVSDVFLDFIGASFVLVFKERHLGRVLKWFS